ncbi:hypothetical protein [Desulfovibrio aminophilus]|nr:hypothetical protein [Desulfovibrio aminophilus]
MHEIARGLEIVAVLGLALGLALVVGFGWAVARVAKSWRRRRG